MDRWKELTAFSSKLGYRNISEAFAAVGRNTFLEMERSSKAVNECSRENVIKYVFGQSKATNIKSIEKAFGKHNVKSVQNNVLRLYQAGKLKRVKFKFSKYYHYGLPEWFEGENVLQFYLPKQKPEYNPRYLKTLKMAA